VPPYITDGTKSLHQIGVETGVQPAHILRLSAIADSVFAPGVAAYVNGVFAGTIPPAEPMPKGLPLTVPRT
jgi:hypothetical protein